MRATNLSWHSLQKMYLGTMRATMAPREVAQEIIEIALGDTDECFEARDFVSHLLDDEDPEVRGEALACALTLRTKGRDGQVLRAALMRIESGAAVAHVVD